MPADMILVFYAVMILAKPGNDRTRAFQVPMYMAWWLTHISPSNCMPGSVRMGCIVRKTEERLGTGLKTVRPTRKCEPSPR